MSPTGPYKGVWITINNLKPNSKATISYTFNGNGSIGGSSAPTVTVDNDGYCSFHIENIEAVEYSISKIQIEYGESSTTYEPYKSNILTVNEDVTLRGIGDVKDELDCLTGEVTERTGFLKSTDIPNNSWYGYTEYDNGLARITYMLRGAVITPSNSNMICDKYLVANNMNDTLTVSNIALGDTANPVLHLNVPYNLLPSQSLQGFIEYVEQNPFSITYQLAQPIIKTVDLTILDQNGQNVKQLMSFNGGTHFNTGSLEGSPLPSVTVTVETDLEETLRVCSLDGNTM